MTTHQVSVKRSGDTAATSGELPSIAVILPAFNEELTIAATIEGFHQALPKAAIWVINNRSTDRTEQVACDVLSRMACRGGVLNEFSQGKGNALRRAFLDINAHIYVLADADLTYPPQRASDLIAPVMSGAADMVVGDRLSGGHYAAENKRAFHGLGNRLVRYLVNKLFRANLADIMSGYRVLSRRFVKSYPILVDGFEIETDMTLHALDKKFRIIEIPVEYRDRPEGSYSKLSTFSDGSRVIFTIARILRHYRPLAFFGGAGLLLAVSGLLAAVPVFDDWIQYRYIHHIPLAILATGIEIVALLTISIGLVLDSIADHGRRAFERELLR